ncbi:MAG: hypothetical protein ABI625_11825 [bacterium]
MDITHEMVPGRPLRERYVLWGAPNSGKSGFVGSLYGLFSLKTKSARWTAHPRDALTDHTAKELKRAYLDLKERGNAKTDIREPEPLHLNIRKQQGERDVDVVELFLLDPAGEILTDEAYRESALGTTVYENAAHSRGLIWLVNVEQSRESRTQSQAAILPELIKLLEASGGEQIDVPVAICLSMIDRLPSDSAREHAIQDPRSALRAQVGAAVPRWFEALCPNHRYFAVSSTGLHDGHVEPINVSEVLDWIVQQGRKRHATAVVVANQTPVSSSSASPAELFHRAVASLGGAMDIVRPLRKPIAAFAAVVGIGWAGITIGPRLLAARPTSTATPIKLGGAVVRPIANPSTSIRNDAWLRATRKIDSAAAGASAVWQSRYARAHACVTERLGCDAQQIIRDFTWSGRLGNSAQRGEAKRVIDSLSGLGLSSR